MSYVDVVRHADEEALADAVAARLITTIVERTAARGVAHVCLTGGGIGTAVLAAVGSSPSRDAIDWSAVHIWWGDERYLPEGDPERNETGARAALLDLVPIPEDHVHPMPGPDRSDGSVGQAAAVYAQALAAYTHPDDHALVPSMDVLMLGIGPDAHVASLFPGLPGVHEGGAVIPVFDSPKPPPTRISLTFSSINAAHEVWILASGSGKAAAIRAALSEGADPAQVPAAGVHGRERTLVLIDDQAAADLPASMGRPGA
jgi:6-phosphogluconolactonase